MWGIGTSVGADLSRPPPIYRPLMDVPISLVLVKTHHRLVSVGEMAKNNYRYDKSYFLLLSIARRAGVGQGR